MNNLVLRTSDGQQINASNTLVERSEVLKMLTASDLLPSVVPVQGQKKDIEILEKLLQDKVMLKDVGFDDMMRLFQLSDYLGIEDIQPSLYASMRRLNRQRYTTSPQNASLAELERDLQEKLGYSKGTEVFIESFVDLMNLYEKCSDDDGFMSVCQTHKETICKVFLREIGFQPKSRYCDITNKVMKMVKSRKNFDEDMKDGEIDDKMKYIQRIIISLAPKHMDLYFEWGVNPNLATEYDTLMSEIMMVSKGQKRRQTVETLLKAGATPTAIDMLRASSLQDEWILQTMIRAGGDVNAKNKWGTTPLMTAVRANNVNSVSMLLRVGTNANAKDKDGLTALMLAGKNARIVQLLLEAGADANAIDNSGRCVLLHALKEHYDYIDMAIMDVLLPKIVDVNCNSDSDEGFTPLIYATYKGTLPLVQRFVDAGGNVNAKTDVGTTPLMYAVLRADFDMAQILLKAGADVNAKTIMGETVLMLSTKTARSAKNARILQLLLDAGADANAIDNSGRSVLYHVLHADPYHIDMAAIDVLLPRVADVNSYKKIVVDVTKLGPFPLLEKIINAGGNVHVRNSKGYTPLMVAASLDDIDKVQALLAAGAHINAQDKIDGMTALDFAIGEQADNALIDLLIRAGGKSMKFR